MHLLEKETQKDYKKNREEWKKYDWGFHLALVSNCRSQNLLNLHSILYDKYIRYQMAVTEYRGKEAEEEHKIIFEGKREQKREKHILKIIPLQFLNNFYLNLQTSKK